MDLTSYDLTDEQFNEYQSKIEDFLVKLISKNFDDIDILYHVDEVQDIPFDDAFAYIEDRIRDNGGFDVEIIYYTKAIEYLSNEDPSLQESLEIAYECGYTTDNLDSELLASLLASTRLAEAFCELHGDIEEFFEELEVELDNLNEEDYEE